MKKNIRYFIAFFIIWLSSMSFFPATYLRNTKTKIHSGSNLIIHFKATINGETLSFKKNYINPFNETFSLEKFKFYFGKPRLIDQVTHKEISLTPNKYALIDFTDSTSCSLQFSIRPGKYSSLKFLLGVDSIDNVSGAQSGALDPAKGMFWIWNSGYVMAKLEGTSPVSNQPAHAIAYHIGGFRQPDNTARILNLQFPNGSFLEINESKKYEVFITVEINKWFSDTHPIHIKEIPTCTTPGKLASMFADNYSNMFNVTQVIN